MTQNAVASPASSMLGSLFNLRGSSDAADIANMTGRKALWLRIAMAVAMFSISLENNHDVGAIFKVGTRPLALFEGQETFVILLACCMCLHPKYTRMSIAVFAVTLIPYAPNFLGLANHQILGFWCILPALLVKDWVSSRSYATYLRVTFGMVMLAAFAQKLVAGTYIDGSYLQFLVTNSTKTTARWFGFVCSSGPAAPCLPIVVASNFILFWQAIVGVFLIIGWKNIGVLIIEIGFLIGAGVFADEFNFQVLNIALLAIVFRTGVPIIGAVILVIVTIADLWGLGAIGTQVGLIIGGAG